MPHLHVVMRIKIDVLRISDRRLHASQIGRNSHQDQGERQCLPVVERLHQRDRERHERNERYVICKDHSKEE